MGEEINLTGVSRNYFGQYAKYFESPQTMLVRAMEYIDWCHNNPLYSTEQVKKPGKEIIIPVPGTDEIKVIPPELLVEIPKKRAPNWSGLSIFCGVGNSYFNTMKKKLKSSEMKDDADGNWAKAIDMIEAMIFNDNYEGAAAGMLNPGLTQSYLNIASKIETKNENKTIKEVFKIGEIEIEF